MDHVIFSMGWIKDYPDLRDYTISTTELSEKHKKLGQKDTVKTMLKKVGVDSKKSPKVPGSVDLRQWCSPVENQGNLGACTAHAGVGVLEYFEKRAFGSYLDASRLFLYKTTRKLLGWNGDTGATLRGTMAAMVMFGVPLEKYCKYDTGSFDVEPSAFLYSMAQDYKAVSYYRLDPPGTKLPDLLDNIKNQLVAGLPAMFGFTCYDSIRNAGDGKIPFPGPKEKVVGGHAIAAVGYDDSVVIENGDVKTKGALLIRNSWGSNWGLAGYGYLPYEYVLRGQAADFWCLIKNEWIDTGQFNI